MMHFKVEDRTGFHLRSRKNVPVNSIVGSCLLINGSGLTLRNLKILNPVAWVFSISGSNIGMYNTFIDARSMNGFPFNTGMPPHPPLSASRTMF